MLVPRGSTWARTARSPAIVSMAKPVRRPAERKETPRPSPNHTGMGGIDRRSFLKAAGGLGLLSVIPLSRLALSGGGRTTGTQLFFKRRLP